MVWSFGVEVDHLGSLCGSTTLLLLGLQPLWPGSYFVHWVGSSILFAGALFVCWSLHEAHSCSSWVGLASWMAKLPLAAPLFTEIASFNILIALASKFSKKGESKFVKRAEEIPKIEICAPQARSHALQLVDNGLISQFTGLWPSPKMVKAWIEKNWKPLIKGAVLSSFRGKGFYNFYFENRLDKDLVFKSGPYFMGS